MVRCTFQAASSSICWLRNWLRQDRGTETEGALDHAGLASDVTRDIGYEDLIVQDMAFSISPINSTRPPPRLTPARAATASIGRTQTPDRWTCRPMTDRTACSSRRSSCAWRMTVSISSSAGGGQDHIHVYGCARTAWGHRWRVDADVVEVVRAMARELCGKVGDGSGQAAILVSAAASIPSLNFTPQMSFGN